MSTEGSSDHTVEAAAEEALALPPLTVEALAAANKEKEKAILQAEKAAADTASGEESGEEEAAAEKAAAMKVTAEKVAAEKATAAEKVAAEKAAAAEKAVEERDALEKATAEAKAKADTLAKNLTEKTENLKQLKLKDDVHHSPAPLCRPLVALNLLYRTRLTRLLCVPPPHHRHTPHRLVARTRTPPTPLTHTAVRSMGDCRSTLPRCNKACLLRT